MFTKMKNKLQNMSTQDWITVSLWLVSLALLLAFVIAAGSMDRTDAIKYNDVKAGLALGFGVALIIAMFTTVFYAYKKKRGNK